MKPAPFTYHRATSAREAVDMLAATGDDGSVLAGGQSLVPLMNFRVAQPAHLVDINYVDELDYIRIDDGAVAIGARTRQATLERSADVARAAPLLREAIGWVAHPPVRHRGTVVGSIVHADPAAELPACLLALDGEVVLQGPGGERRVPAREFFTGPLMTAKQTGELATEVRVPVANGSGETGHALVEFSRRHADFAVAGAAVSGAAIAPFRVPGTPLRANEAQQRPPRGGGGRGVPATATPGPPAGMPAMSPKPPLRACSRTTTSTAARPTGAASRAPASSARSAGPGTEVRDERGPDRDDGQRRPLRARGRGAPAARRLPARGPRPRRHARRVRARRLRHLHGPHERRVEPLVHHVRRAGLRPRDHDRRGAHRQRRDAPAAGGVLGEAGAAVRLLHARDAAARERDPRREPRPEPRGGQGGDLLEPVPLHRLRLHRRLRPRGGAAHARRQRPRAAAARRPAPRDRRARHTRSRPRPRGGPRRPVAQHPPPRVHRGERKWVGQSVRRIEDPKFLLGKGGSIDDMRVRGMLHAALVRSPHAHAKITSIDTSRATALPGVFAVVTGAEAAEITDPMPDFGPAPDKTTWRCLAADKVRYVGEGVVAVLAESRYVAEDAADLIEIEYELLDPVVDPEEALKDGAALVHDALGSNVAYERAFTFGEVDRDFADAGVVVKDRLRWHRSGGQPLETVGAIANFDRATGMLTIDTNTLSFTSYLFLLAGTLKVPANKLDVIPHPAGGSFGSKLWAVKVSAIAGLLSKVSGRPVKYLEDRVDNIANCDHHGSDRVYDVELALTPEGLMKSLKIRSLDDYGAYIQFGVGHHGNALAQVVGPYRIKSVQYTVTAVMTNKCQQGAYRGFGSEVNNWMLERMVDLAAKELHLDAVEIRRRNLIGKDEFPYFIPTGNVYDSGDYERVLDTALELADLDHWRAGGGKGHPGGGLT